jgi:hypothetical protein
MPILCSHCFACSGHSLVIGLAVGRSPKAWPPLAQSRISTGTPASLSEDETDVANLVIWTSIFEKNRRAVLGASMMGVRGQAQRKGDVIHIVAQRLGDLSGMLASVGDRDNLSDVYRVSRADVVKHGMGPDHRDPDEKPLGRSPRDIFIPDLRLGSGIIPGQPTEASRCGHAIFAERFG